MNLALADIRDKIHADLSRVLVPVARLAMRASITVVIIVNMLLTMALWSVNSGAWLGG